jgi:excisionase family DNA binding protein
MKNDSAFPELEALPPLLRIRQAADAVGMSYNTIRRRITDGSLVAYRVGPKEIRVDRDSLLKLARSTVVEA